MPNFPTGVEGGSSALRRSERERDLRPRAGVGGNAGVGGTFVSEVLRLPLRVARRGWREEGLNPSHPRRFARTARRGRLAPPRSSEGGSTFQARSSSEGRANRPGEPPLAGRAPEFHPPAAIREAARRGRLAPPRSSEGGSTFQARSSSEGRANRPGEPSFAGRGLELESVAAIREAARRGRLAPPAPAGVEGRPATLTRGPRCGPPRRPRARNGRRRGPRARAARRWCRSGASCRSGGRTGR